MDFKENTPNWGACFPGSETALFFWLWLGHMEDEAMPLLILLNLWEFSTSESRPAKQEKILFV